MKILTTKELLEKLDVHLSEIEKFDYTTEFNLIKERQKVIEFLSIALYKGIDIELLRIILFTIYNCDLKEIGVSYKKTIEYARRIVRANITEQNS